MADSYRAEDYIETYSGRRFVFSDPQPESFAIEDIAHALSNLCRYNGHCQRFMSVAEHSMLLASRYTEHNPDDPKTALDMLMHDAAEAYLCDLPRPIKYTLADYRAAEAKIDAALAKRFALSSPMPPIVKEWDSRIIVDERAQIMAKTDNVWGVDHLEPLGVKIWCLTPPEAEKKFLLWYKSLKAASF